MSSVYDEPPPPNKTKAKKRASDIDGSASAKQTPRKGKRKSEVISDPDEVEDGGGQVSLIR